MPVHYPNADSGLATTFKPISKTTLKVTAASTSATNASNPTSSPTSTITSAPSASPPSTPIRASIPSRLDRQSRHQTNQNGSKRKSLTAPPSPYPATNSDYPRAPKSPRRSSISPQTRTNAFLNPLDDIQRSLHGTRSPRRESLRERMLSQGRRSGEVRAAPGTLGRDLGARSPDRQEGAQVAEAQGPADIARGADMKGEQETAREVERESAVARVQQEALDAPATTINSALADQIRITNSVWAELFELKRLQPNAPLLHQLQEEVAKLRHEKAALSDEMRCYEEGARETREAYDNEYRKKEKVSAELYAEIADLEKSLDEKQQQLDQRRFTAQGLDSNRRELERAREDLRLAREDSAMLRDDLLEKSVEIRDMKNERKEELKEKGAQFSTRERLEKRANEAEGRAHEAEALAQKQSQRADELQERFRKQWNSFQQQLTGFKHALSVEQQKRDQLVTEKQDVQMKLVDKQNELNTLKKESAENRAANDARKSAAKNAELQQYKLELQKCQHELKRCKLVLGQVVNGKQAPVESEPESEEEEEENETAIPGAAMLGKHTVQYPDDPLYSPSDSVTVLPRINSAFRSTSFALTSRNTSAATPMGQHPPIYPFWFPGTTRRQTVNNINPTIFEWTPQDVEVPDAQSVLQTNMDWNKTSPRWYWSDAPVREQTVRLSTEMQWNRASPVWFAQRQNHPNKKRKRDDGGYRRPHGRRNSVRIRDQHNRSNDGAQGFAPTNVYQNARGAHDSSSRGGMGGRGGRDERGGRGGRENGRGRRGYGRGGQGHGRGGQGNSRGGQGGHGGMSNRGGGRRPTTRAYPGIDDIS